MIRLDFNTACNMANASLPEDWIIEIHLRNRASWLDLFPPDGARQDFSVPGMTMSDQFLKALAAAKYAKNVA